MIDEKNIVAHRHIYIRCSTGPVEVHCDAVVSVLLDIRKRRLEMDFVLAGDDHSMHALNAVSPAFTCSLPFSQYVRDWIQQAVH